MSRALGGGGGVPRSAFGSAATGSTLSYLAEPPSFAAVSDPNLVVSLKNVLKKDSTTKAKALEDLLQHVQAHPHDQGGGVEEALLAIWTQIYPRISIDNSRRVRELSHTIQFELLKSARKRMERHLPKVVGAWLSGLYDRDRVVARAANEGLSSFLNTPEKVSGFWHKCRAQILDYALEAIQETRDTLSDERSTTAEDAEAKYFRVVAASLSLVLELLQLRDAGLEQLSERYDEYFGEDVVWKAITFNDQQVRKAACQLLFICLERKLPYADSSKARQAFVTGGLKTSQAGSALEYVRALTKLTQHTPAIWEGSPKDKKSPFTRLQAFIAKGSQGSPPRYWEYLDQLLALIPANVLTVDASSGLLSSLKSGITSREEPRTNTSYSWKCFVDAATRCLMPLSDDERLALAKEHLFPLFEQFLFSVSGRPNSIPLGPNAMTVIVDIHVGLLQTSPRLAEAVGAEWDRLGAQLCTNIAGSLPEVSKDYQTSQGQIGEEGRRWFGLVGLLHGELQKSGVVDNTASPSTKAVSQCLMLLESRNLKPFGAAKALEYALSTAPHLFDGELGGRLAHFLRAAAEDDMAKVMQSASSTSLFSSLHMLGSIPGQQESYEAIWRAWASATLLLSDPDQRKLALTSLLSQHKAASLARNTPALQDILLTEAHQAAHADQGSTNSHSLQLITTALDHKAVEPETRRRIAKDAVATLATPSDHPERVLAVLEAVASSAPELFSEDDAIRTELVALLLGLTELSDSVVSAKAARIRSLVDGEGSGTLPVIEIIQSNLDRAGPQSLEIGTLVSQAMAAAGTDAPWEEIFPSTNVWMTELSPFLDRPLHPSLAITCGVGGAVSLPRRPETLPSSQIRTSRDRRGRSVPGRMALYVSELFRATGQNIPLLRQLRIELLYLQCLSLQLASDQITVAATNGLWQSLEEDEAALEAEELVTSSRSMLNDVVSSASGWIDTTDDSISGVVNGLVDLAMKEATDYSPRGVYSARVLSEVLQALTDAHGLPGGAEERFLRPDTLKARPETVFLAAGLVKGFGESLQASKAVGNFCNRLVSDIAAASADGERTCMTLVLFTLCAQLYEAGELPVANNRIVFAAKQITSWAEDLDVLDPGLCAEMCRALAWLLPSMKGVYGSYWEKALQLCTGLWERAGQLVLEQALPFIHSSLKLYKVLESIEDPNDDLQEALRDLSAAKSRDLVELLKLPRDSDSQPLAIVDGMLCREVEKIPVARIPDPVSLFPLVASESRDIQTAAFNMLHRKIPEQQQQQAVDMLLDKIDARLPDELLSLLLDPPTLDKFSDEVLADFPSSIRCYLLTWKLLFDAFSSSSFKTRSDYTEHLKSGDYASPLLEFLFDVLGHSAAHPLNLDREGLGAQQICDYDVKLAESGPAEQNLHWLMVHVYYLALKYVPGLFRAWYLDCRSKQTKIAVEAWTTKYFSPLIISETLDGVQDWADTQEPAPADEQELIVKVSKTAREVTAAYEVDESQAAIVIKLSSSYPIEGVTVSGLHRVAVSERKWQSWILTTQGVITFSNGSIIDGLQVFKRNITGALKGQSECAICYSIISADKRTPDKRCTTCKNLFHRTCLYKWFQSSNQNTCPLCRNPIDYLGSDTAAKRRQ
ncbi:sorting nexin-41 [Purpureocillium lavendulum]|uniref:E3 ubiquitin-protein ligase listerin n=1 Tax=Purpureocillium lavendulum TaxID=1247861 RepID=A0AB34G7C4_9HYPO|nr:sorting nexin-41 [Purpureocillium lavendulum]